MYYINLAPGEGLHRTKAIKYRPSPRSTSGFKMFNTSHVTGPPFCFVMNHVTSHQRAHTQKRRIPTIENRYSSTVRE